jgi:hypothetical protein
MAMAKSKKVGLVVDEGDDVDFPEWEAFTYLPWDLLIG